MFTIRRIAPSHRFFLAVLLLITGFPMSNNPTTFDVAQEFAHLTATLRGGYPFLKPTLDDTTVVLMATSLIDVMLKFTLVIRFRKDVVSKTLLENVFEGNGPLSTFSSKISLCIALGLFDKNVRHDLQILRKIRNEFAHSPNQLHLSDFPQCNNLTIVVADVKIEDAVHERRNFKHSCTGIIPAICIGVAVSIAEARVLHAHKSEVLAEAQNMVSKAYSLPGAAPPK